MLLKAGFLGRTTTSNSELGFGSANGVWSTAEQYIVKAFGTWPYMIEAVPNATSVNENATVTYNVVSNSLVDGTYYWTIDLDGSTAVAADFVVTSGSFTLTSGAGSFQVQTVAEFVTEGSEQFRVYIRATSISGPILSTTSFVTINDTSLTLTGTFTSNTTSVNEGASILFTASVSASYTGTLYYTITGTPTTADFTDGLLSGSFAVTSGSGTFTKTLATDYITPESETFTASLRYGSTAGYIIANTSTITINDVTPVTPTYVGANTRLGSTSMNLPPGLQQGDVIVYAGFKIGSAIAALPTGYTGSGAGAVTGSNGRVNAYKVMGATPDTTISGLDTSAGHVVLAFRNVTTTAPTATFTSAYPPNPASMTVADGDQVAVFAFVNASTTLTAPTGYTNMISASNSTITVGGASRTAFIVGITSENPAAFGSTAGTTGLTTATRLRP